MSHHSILIEWIQTWAFTSFVFHNYFRSERKLIRPLESWKIRGKKRSESVKNATLRKKEGEKKSARRARTKSSDWSTFRVTSIRDKVILALAKNPICGLKDREKKKEWPPVVDSPLRGLLFSLSASFNECAIVWEPRSDSRPFHLTINHVQSDPRKSLWLYSILVTKA